MTVIRKMTKSTSHHKRSNLSLFKPGMSPAINDIKAIRYIWSAIDSPFIPWFTHPFLFVVYSHYPHKQSLNQNTQFQLNFFDFLTDKNRNLERMAQCEKINGGGGGGWTRRADRSFGLAQTDRPVGSEAVGRGSLAAANGDESGDRRFGAKSVSGECPVEESERRARSHGAAELGRTATSRWINRHNLLRLKPSDNQQPFLFFLIREGGVVGSWTRGSLL